MAKLKVPYTRRSVFSGVMAYLSYVERLKKRYNAVDGTFNDAVKLFAFNDQRNRTVIDQGNFHPGLEFAGLCCYSFFSHLVREISV